MPYLFCCEALLLARALDHASFLSFHICRDWVFTFCCAAEQGLHRWSSRTHTPRGLAKLLWSDRQHHQHRTKNRIWLRGIRQPPGCGRECRQIPRRAFHGQQNSRRAFPWRWQDGQIYRGPRSLLQVWQYGSLGAVG
ncbi:hypothetical protein C8R44DRAFT_309718 [Mycena epipterygia]|nr:hypothetical protein C8R44DRAFT_309718 [Mycena epipterygia]